MKIFEGDLQRSCWVQVGGREKEILFFEQRVLQYDDLFPIGAFNKPKLLDSNQITRYI
jgi:hypothetical protein